MKKTIVASAVSRVSEWLRYYKNNPQDLVLEEKDKNDIFIKGDKIYLKTSIVTKYFGDIFASDLFSSISNTEVTLALKAISLRPLKSVLVNKKVQNMWEIRVDRLTMSLEELDSTREESRTAEMSKKEEIELNKKTEEAKRVIKDLTEFLMDENRKPSTLIKAQSTVDLLRKEIDKAIKATA